jgi:diguanylate cyclase (GGDEF)-like protein
VESSRRGPAAVATTGALTRRLLRDVVLAVLAFAIAHRVALAVTDDAEIVSILAGAGAALVVATVALRHAVAPLIATQAELRVRYEAALAEALRDPLTRLGNHRAFHEELDRQVAVALRYDVPLSLLLLDLDEFKAINDGRGHAEGDHVLRTFAELLGISVRRADRAFRIGGDEFAILLPHTDLEGAISAARRLLAQALQPTWRADVEAVSFSGGVTSLPELALGPAELYAQADAALYAAKRGGRTEVAAFRPTMELTSKGAGSAAAAVVEVISKGQLEPVYQPIVSLAAGRRIIGFEGLIRPVSPAPFRDPGTLFAAAAAAGRLTALDLACVEAVVAGAQRLPEDQFLSINLSPPSLEAAEFSTGALMAILARYGFPPDRLVIELTEHQQLDDPGRVRGKIDAWRRAGIQFAADDVGAGNAGLRLLSEVRFDMLKVDLTLVQRSASDGQSSAVLGSVVELAARTGALLVAEGIERETQIAQLVALGITAGQGYFLGRPGPIAGAALAPTAAVEPATGVAAWRQTIGLPSVN